MLVGGGIKLLNHEYIELLYDCYNCGYTNLRVVVDFNKDNGG